MKKIQISIVSLLLALLVSSCGLDNDRVVIGTGSIEEMEVVTPDFHGVSVDGTCDVNILIGEKENVIFHAQNEILDVLDYVVKDGILQIGFKPNVSIRDTDEIWADIVVPELSYIAVSGVSDFYLQGAGQDHLMIRINGVGKVDAYDMLVKSCDVRISGTGECKLNVENSLALDVSGVGVITYKGSPSVDSNIKGVCEIYQFGESR